MMRPKRCLLCTLIYLLVLLLLLFLIIFVIVPVLFKNNVDIQRTIIFPAWARSEKLNLSDTQQFGIRGVRNFYVTVDEEANVTLGAWHIIPKEFVSSVVVNDKYYQYDNILSNKKYDILLYLHGNGAVRYLATELYELLRGYFQIIAVDYRGYADSTKAELTEENIVNDIVNVYNWLRMRTKARIFIWGHSLGTGIGTHTISVLKSQNTTPTGLILETPFTSIPDVMEYNFFIRLISWLPWYKQLTLQPVIDNGFGFNSSKYIQDVDCPIMILHAKDDTVVSYQLADRLFETATSHRNSTSQGNITYHLFDAVGYDHYFIYLAPQLPAYIEKFKKDCFDFQNQTTLVEKKT